MSTIRLAANVCLLSGRHTAITGDVQLPQTATVSRTSRIKRHTLLAYLLRRKVKKGTVSIYQSAQTWITQFYLQITPCLPFLHKRSLDGATPITEAADIQLQLTTRLSFTYGFSHSSWTFPVPGISCLNPNHKLNLNSNRNSNHTNHNPNPTDPTLTILMPLTLLIPLLTLTLTELGRGNVRGRIVHRICQFPVDVVRENHSDGRHDWQCHRGRRRWSVCKNDIVASFRRPLNDD